MVLKGTVLRHRISIRGIEVNKAKIEVIKKFQPLVSVKGISSFLGLAGLYRRFIEDFYKIFNTLFYLLDKEFNFF